MKQTPFTNIHRSLNAKLVEFAGFEMPIQYSGIIDEHLAVRNSVGVFDVSHMGEFVVRGPGALRFLQNVTINDVTHLSPGKVQYTAMCYDDGGIVDDLLLYHCGDYYMLVVNAANLKKDFDWLSSHVGSDVTLEDQSDATALLAVQGPNSLAVLQPLCDADLGSLAYYSFLRATIAGIPVLISRTGYTGELGFEIYVNADYARATALWNEIFKAGASFGIKPVGLGARDTLRLEMGFCLYGNDIDPTTNPIEAGLGWITKTEKGDFVGKANIAAARQTGPSRRLVGLVLPDRALARKGYEITLGGLPVGIVTSGNFSPILKRGIAMGYVKSEYAKPGTELAVSVRGQQVPATVTKPPFVKK